MHTILLPDLVYIRCSSMYNMRSDICTCTKGGYSGITVLMTRSTIAKLHTHHKTRASSDTQSKYRHLEFIYGSLSYFK